MPLQTKIFTTGVITVILSEWWIRVALHHSRQAHENWFNTGLWTLFAIYAIAIQFRKSKRTASETAASEDKHDLNVSTNLLILCGMKILKESVSKRTFKSDDKVIPPHSEAVYEITGFSKDGTEGPATTHGASQMRLTSV